MSEPLPVNGPSGGIPARGVSAGGVRAAIARAAQRTGVDFDYLLAQARIESSLDPSAKASTSSAAGLYQFTNSTWLNTLDRHGADHGLAWAGDAIEGGRVTNPAMRAQVMALRYDPDAAALMAGELANDNRADLTARLGRQPDASELYLAHFLGSAGAGQFLGALAADPGQSAAAILPAAAAANHRIFYDASGAPRSVSGVMAVMRDKVVGAMGEGGASGVDDFSGMGGAWAEYGTPAPGTSGYVAPGGGFASASSNGFAAGSGNGLASEQAPARPSMAETLRQTFGLGSGAAGALSGGAEAPGFVKSAYGKLQAWGL